MPAEKTSARRRNYHHGSLRRALIDAASSILQNEGVDALSLRAAARRAGVSQAAPYHHFENRDDLLAAVAAEGFNSLQEVMKSAMGAERRTAARRLFCLARNGRLRPGENSRRAAVAGRRSGLHEPEPLGQNHLSRGHTGAAQQGRRNYVKQP
jgi:AcrR family transcriptional regulator